jgi:DNA end-binding protein Ku
MAGKTIWKGYIHFSTVNIPVKLHTGVKEERIQFHLLHARDNNRLTQQMVCARENIPVASEEQTKGYEVEKGSFVVVDPDELKAADPEGTRMIEIKEFVKKEEIDPRFLERTYYLEADNSEKAYVTLAEALKDTGLAGLAEWAMRRRNYLGVLQAGDKTLRLTTMRYSDEVVPADTLELPSAPLHEREISTGMMLIKQMSGPFEPGRYRNEYEKKLRALIEAKARGEKIKTVRPKRMKATPSDELLKALKESLKKSLKERKA